MHLHICLPRATCAWATVLALFLVVMAGPTRAPQYARVSTVGLQGQRCQVSADLPKGVVAPGMWWRWAAWLTPLSRGL